MRRCLFALFSLILPLSAHDEVTPKPKLIQPGLPVRQIALGHDEGIVFKIEVPPGARALSLRTRGGDGDVDLFARHLAHPTRTQHAAASEAPGTQEKIDIAEPAAGAWYVLMKSLGESRGVKLLAELHLAKGSVPAPRMLPPPGVFSGQAIVRLRCPHPHTVLRYTLDGSEPTAASPAYPGPLHLFETTRLRARAFHRSGKTSIEADARYTILPGDAPAELASGQPVHHRATIAGGSHLFRIVLPPEQTRLRIVAEGGTGKAELFVRHGSAPDRRTFDAKGFRKRQQSVVDLTNPAPGEWFILLRGRTGTSGYSLLAQARGPGVDLIPWQPALDPVLSVETFSPADCEVEEGLIAAGTHRLLRFGMQTRNIGTADLVMPSPVDHPDFEFHPCHGHYHFLGFARYRLLDAAGQEAATGRKVSFCLLDSERWDDKAPSRPRFTCSAQGIQAGWGDTYDAGLPGQWIEIDGVPPGTYTLEVAINPDGILAETDSGNNTATVEVEIPAP
jgi:hypothetical protein